MVPEYVNGNWPKVTPNCFIQAVLQGYEQGETSSYGEGDSLVREGDFSGRRKHSDNG